MNADLAAQRALDRMRHDGFESLSSQDRVLATVWLFAAGVGNGGFKGYLESERGATAAFAPQALGEIGALAHAGLVGRANALFAGGQPPTSTVERRAQMERWPASVAATLEELDREYYACEEDVDDLLETYLRRAGLP